jgi:hypothetical protein
MNDRAEDSVIEAKRLQRTFGDGLIAEEIADLQEAWMHQVDAVLQDESIVSATHQALLNSYPRSRSQGRPGYPAEVVLRPFRDMGSSRCGGTFIVITGRTELRVDFPKRTFQRAVENSDADVEKRLHRPPVPAHLLFLHRAPATISLIALSTKAVEIGSSRRCGHHQISDDLHPPYQLRHVSPPRSGASA